MRYAILTAFLLLSTLTAKAGCYTNNMSTYQSIASDSTTITVSEVADGSYAMCEIPPGYPPNFIHHTTYSSVTLKSNTGATHTGSGSTTGCPTCYASVESVASLLMGSDDSWDVSWSDSVDCSIAGTVFSVFGIFSSKLTTTYGNLVSQYTVTTEPCSCNDYQVGTYGQQCTNGNIYASCPVYWPAGAKTPQWSVPYPPGQPPYKNVITKFLSTEVLGITARCIQLGGLFFQPKPAPATGGPCN